MNGPRLHWKMARAEFERLKRDAKVIRNSGGVRTVKAQAIHSLLAAADEALHIALEVACE